MARITPKNKCNIYLCYIILQKLAKLTPITNNVLTCGDVHFEKLVQITPKVQNPSSPCLLSIWCIRLWELTPHHQTSQHIRGIQQLIILASIHTYKVTQNPLSSWMLIKNQTQYFKTKHSVTGTFLNGESWILSYRGV